MDGLFFDTGGHQYITPHNGYFMGFMRYHLGVVIPENNISEKCWIRIANDKIKKKKLKELGTRYFWKNGEGILFNDNYTHDAANESNEVRVVMWLDVERKFPFPFNLINRLMLKIAYSTKTIRNIRLNAEVGFK